MEEDRIEIRIPRKSEFLMVLRLILAGVANLLQFNTEEIEDIKLAVSEACFNAIRGKELKDPKKDIKIICYLQGNKLTIKVIDTHRKDIPDLSYNEPVEEALALLLMRNLMDKVEYKVDEKSTTIQLTKYSRIEPNYSIVSTSSSNSQY